MTQVGLAIFIIILYELLIYLKFTKHLKLNLSFYKKLFLYIFNSTLTDDKKEKLVLKYSKKLFLISLKIIMIMILILLSFYIIDLYILKIIGFSLSKSGIFFSIIVIIIYKYLRSYICKIII